MSARCWIAPVLVLACASCFVSEGECVQRGVNVTPCAVNGKAGQTIVLRASVAGAPDAPVDWILPETAEAAFQAEASGNQLVLVSKQNIPGVYPVQASSQSNPALFGGSAVGVSTATFGGQAPPVVFFGGDLPVGSKAGATAAGGNLYYVAYAAVGALLPESASLGPTPSANFFVQQYDLATNQLLADVPGQFQQFTGAGGSPIVPNVAADCLGNGYWVDALGGGPTTNYVLRRLAPGAASPDQQVLGLFDDFQLRTLSVACDGAVYFVGDPVGNQGPPILFRLPGFGSTPEQVIVTPSFLTFAFDSLIVDPLGRLYYGVPNPDGTPPIERLTIDPDASPGPEAFIDPTFVCQLQEGVTGLAVDSAGVVYGSVNGQSAPRISALNSLGDVVYSVGSYELFCPDGCVQPECGTVIPFTRIAWFAAAPNGALRIVDDPLTASLPPACRETLRIVLLDPQ